MSEKRLALFDFDGTITNCDTLWDFHRFAFGTRAVLFSLFSLFGAVSAQTAKEAILSHFWRGKPSCTLQKFAESYKGRVNEITRKEAREAIAYHKKNGDITAIVSASVADWIEPWARENGLHEVIASRMEILDGVFTGKLAGKNCNSAEKVVRVREKFDLSEFSSIYVYGDSRGDREMLALGTKKFYRWREI